MALCVPGPMIPPREEPPGEQAVTMADEEIVEVEDLEEDLEEVEEELDEAEDARTEARTSLRKAEQAREQAETALDRLRKKR